MADTPRVRVPLSLKFCAGSLAVAAAAVVFPELAPRLGFAVSWWASPFVALGAGGLLGYALSRQISRRYVALLAATDRIEKGDLAHVDAFPPSGTFRDETDDLADSLRSTVEGLRELVAQVQGTTLRVAGSAEELTRSVEGVSGAHEEISATVGEVARGAAQQTALLDEVSRVVHEIAAAIELNASRAREAFGFAAEANQKAHSGVDVSRLALEKMRSVFERVEQAGSMVFQLEAKTRHVHQITEIITSVASRTNLLSLNASIEAARAGEAGPRLRGGRRRDPQARRERGAQRRRDLEADPRDRGRHAQRGGRDAPVEQGDRRGPRRRQHDRRVARADPRRGRRGGRVAPRRSSRRPTSRPATRERMVDSMGEIAKVSRSNVAAIDEVSTTARRQLDAMGEMVTSSKALREVAAELQGTMRRFRTGASEGRP